MVSFNSEGGKKKEAWVKKKGGSAHKVNHGCGFIVLPWHTATSFVCRLTE